VAMLGWTAWLYAQKTNGKEVKVAITGYDPRDLLSGHYIQYTIDWEKTDCSQFAGKICPRDEFCKQKKWGRECRFYIPEANAKQLNTLFLQRNSTDMVFEVVYSYNKGFEPLAKQLLINGQDWHYSIKP
jgi:hypothetical protein